MATKKSKLTGTKVKEWTDLVKGDVVVFKNNKETHTLTVTGLNFWSEYIDAVTPGGLKAELLPSDFKKGWVFYKKRSPNRPS